MDMPQRRKVRKPQSRFGELPSYQIPVPRKKVKRSLGKFQPFLRPQMLDSNISNNMNLNAEDARE